MAQSYRDPNVTCYGPSSNPDTPAGWEAYCNCMFDPSTEEWKRCVSLWCTLPGPGAGYGREPKPWGGCVHPTHHDPFNIDAGMFFAPWTDVGAGVRTIPKPGASVAYTLAQLAHLDVYEFTPLSLWKAYFQNPGLFILKAAKVGMISGVLESVLVGPFGAFNAAMFTQAAVAALVNPPAAIGLLGPPALIQCGIEGKPVWNEMMKPMLLGSFSMVKLAIQTVPTVMGGQIFQAGGAICQKFAQDQFDTGEISKVQDEGTRAFITFLAQHGDELGELLQKAVNGGLSFKSAPSIIEFLRSAFLDLSKMPEMSAASKKVFELIAMACGIAGNVAKGFSGEYTAFQVVDHIVFDLFGISLSELKNSVAGGYESVTRTLGTAQKNGFTSFSAVLDTFSAVAKTFNDLANVISKVNDAVGGALGEFAHQFNDAAASFADGTPGSLTSTIREAQAVIETKGTPVKPSFPSTTAAHPAIAVVNPRAPAPATTSSSSASTGVFTAAAGGLVGGLVGGPVGAGVGVIAGLVLGRKPTAQAYVKVAAVAQATQKPLVVSLTPANAMQPARAGLSPTVQRMVTMNGFSGFAGYGAPAGAARAIAPRSLVPQAIAEAAQPFQMPADVPVALQQAAGVAAEAIGARGVAVQAAMDRANGIVRRVGAVPVDLKRLVPIEAQPPIEVAVVAARPTKFTVRAAEAEAPVFVPALAPMPVAFVPALAPAPAPLKLDPAQAAAAGVPAQVPRTVPTPRAPVTPGTTGTSVVSWQSGGSASDATPGSITPSSEASASTGVETEGGSGSSMLALAAAGGLALFFLTRTKKSKGTRK